jgi:P-type Ca2+ transporter type 2C
LEDPVRPGVGEALKELQKAGITTYIVTGDHPVTTRSVAEQIGLKGDTVTGQQLEKMNDAELRQTLETGRVFARITPSQKLRLVEALKAGDKVVAVIGDGINDAPALRAANASIAMGQIGTDLAKETADLVLTDDNYVHLPQAVSVGRKALDNFRKGLTYYLSAKAILISIFVIPLIMGIPFPLAPIQIILTELLMDLASSTIFVTEAAEPDILNRPPQKIKNFLTASVGRKILRNGLGLATSILAIYLVLYYQTGDIIMAQTAAFTTWLLGHILLAMNLKQEKTPLFKQGFFSNRFATFWLFAMIGLTLTMTFVTPLHSYLKTEDYLH